jgi:lipopolysaccharide export system protein LptA
MRDAGLFWSVFLFTIALPRILDGQERVIELKSANELRGKIVDGEEVRELIGNVHFVQPSATGGPVRVWCARALRYMQQNKVELFGDVRLVRDSTTLQSPEGIYYGNEQRAVMLKGVLLQRGGTILTARSGDYRTREKIARFTGSVVVRDSLSETRCDYLEYFEHEERSIAAGNVQVRNLRDNTMVVGDSLINDDRTRYTIVPRNPRFVQIDTTEEKVDTLLITSSLMEAYQDTARRYIATGNVAVVRSDVAARAAKATYFNRNDVIILQGQPIVWHEENQITGDSIVIVLSNRRLQRVFVFGRAMAISRADTANLARFDQLSGRAMTLHFSDDKLSRIEVDRTATSLYYLYDKGKPNGANRASGDRIEMEFVDGRIERIKIIGGVEGRYLPEEMLAGREQNYNLDGFKWRTDRPQRKSLDVIN